MSKNPTASSSSPKRSIFENPSFLFVAIIVLAVVFVGLMSVPQSEIWLKPIDHFTAFVFAHLANLVGMKTTATGILLTLTLGDQTKSILVGYGCDGVLAYLILVSAILPFPCSIKQKVMGLFTGLLFVFVINQIRLFGLILILFVIKDAEDFAFYHTGVGQVYAMVLIFIFWSWWASKVIKSKQAAAGAAAATDTDSKAVADAG